MKPTAATWLRQAAETIETRSAERDKPTGERSMYATVSAFNALYAKNIVARGYMSETEGWEFMSLLKKARSAGGKLTADDYLDDIAYSALAAESINLSNSNESN